MFFLIWGLDVILVVGFLLENMLREELDLIKDVMRFIFEGVSCRILIFFLKIFR